MLSDHNDNTWYLLCLHVTFHSNIHLTHIIHIRALILQAYHYHHHSTTTTTITFKQWENNGVLHLNCCQPNGVSWDQMPWFCAVGGVQQCFKCFCFVLFSALWNSFYLNPTLLMINHKNVREISYLRSIL